MYATIVAAAASDAVSGELGVVAAALTSAATIGGFVWRHRRKAAAVAAALADDDGDGAPAAAVAVNVADGDASIAKLALELAVKANARLEVLEGKVEEKEARIAALEAELAETKRALSREKADNRKLRTRIIELEAEIEALKSGA